MNLHISVLLAAALSAAAIPASPEPQATFGRFQFEKMRTILGQWEATDEHGKRVLAWYKLISGGTSLLETFKVGDEPEMITVYHLDHDDLVMTHYCSVNNQPRMRAEAPGKDDKAIRFAFVNATNLPDPENGHMHGLVVELQDQDHFTQRWTWREKGKERAVEFNFSRRKKT